MTGTNVPRLLRVKEIAGLTGLEPWRLYELFAAGEGPKHMRVGRTIRVSEAALAEWIEQQHAAPKDEDDA